MKDAEEKRIYQSFDEYIKDNGTYIVIDPSLRNSVSCFHCFEGFKIPKDYLSKSLRWRFVKEVDDEPSEKLEDFVSRLAVEIATDFDREIKRVIGLSNICFSRKVEKSPDDIFIISFISFVLKSELNHEYARILNVIWGIDEDDDEVFYDKLKWQVQYPGETEEERQHREAKYKELDNESEQQEDNSESAE